VATTNRVQVDPDTGVPDLIKQLGSDSKRLVQDEVRLAKLEAKESVHRAARGALWLGVAFAIGVVTMVAFTLFVVTLVGRLANGHMWIGAVVTGVLELVLGALLLKRGMAAFKEPSYTLEETRAEAVSTAHWVKHARQGVQS